MKLANLGIPLEVNLIDFCEQMYPMSIRDQLRNCYETDSEIVITPESTLEITLNDIFVMIQLVTSERCRICFNNDTDLIFVENRICNYGERMYISNTITNPMIYAMVYMIEDIELNVTRIEYGDEELTFWLNGEHILQEFMTTAKKLEMLYYPIVRSILKAFGVYLIPELEVGEQFTQNYLGISPNIKSARK